MVENQCKSFLSDLLGGGCALEIFGLHDPTLQSKPQPMSPWAEPMVSESRKVIELVNIFQISVCWQKTLNFSQKTFLQFFPTHFPGTCIGVFGTVEPFYSSIKDNLSFFSTRWALSKQSGLRHLHWTKSSLSIANWISKLPRFSLKFSPGFWESLLPRYQGDGYIRNA